MKAALSLPAVFVILMTFAPANPAPAATLVVDAANASVPFHTIQSALDQARAGDIVHVKPGVYRERVQFKSGGTAAQPVTLQGEPGAIIDGSDDMKLDWQPAPDIGPGVYRLKSPQELYTITVDGKILTTLNEKRVNPDKPQAIHNGWKNLNWHEVFGGAGVGTSGWNSVRALAMYRHDAGELIVRFQDELDPCTLKMTVSQYEACVRINGQDHCVISGFTLCNASFGVVTAACTGCVVEHCVIGPVDYGVTFNSGSRNCIVRYNDISHRPYSDASYNTPGEWDNWQACKTGGFQDRWAVKMNHSGGGHRIHDNYIHDEWDGVDTSAKGFLDPTVAPDPAINPDIEVDHNYFYRVFDDAIETAGPVRNGRYHHNIFNHCRCAFRIKAPTLGPIFSYNNLFIDNLEDYRNWGENARTTPVTFVPAAAKAEVWIYQNTSTSLSAINMNYSLDVPKGGTSAVNYHYFNNLFWCAKWVAMKDQYSNPDWQGDYNVFVRASSSAPHPWPFPYQPENIPKEQSWADGIALAKLCGLDVHSLFIADKPPGFANAAGGDFSLVADSVARIAGVDLSEYKSMEGLPLPGCANGYFKGVRPDAGALQFGQPMLHVPRKPADVPTSADGGKS